MDKVRKMSDLEMFDSLDFWGRKIFKYGQKTIRCAGGDKGKGRLA